MFLLAVPVLCEQFLSYLVTMTDTWLSGRISREATMAIGLASYVSWLASMLFALVGTGTTALVSRYWGAGEFDEANRVANRSATLAAAMGIAFYGIIYSAAPFLVNLLDLHGETAAIGVRYLRLDGIGHIFYAVTLVLAAALRGSGNMRTPMIVLGVVNVLNMAVSAGLVFGFEAKLGEAAPLVLLPAIGVDGIVIGTVVARVAGCLLMVGLYARGVTGLRLIRRELVVRGPIVRRILAIGMPAALDGALMWGAQFLFLMIVAHLGEGAQRDSIFAAHIVGIRVEAITYLPAVAWGAAAATLVGQSLGAGKPQRAIYSGHTAARQCGMLGGVMTLVFLFGAGPIYRFMHHDPTVAAEGIGALRLLALAQIPLTLEIVYVASLRGAGDTRTPMFINVLGMTAVRLPLAWLFGIHLEGGLIGAWIGMVADLIFRAALVVWRYARGRWIHTVV
ncbi:MAG: MATE family efflux transporter [Planctomycetales bacterium]